ncbi:CBS domain-containing protein [Acidocella aminolytica]|jgi:CBS domain-containing protein|uniref:Signal transduction protein with CBS n=1 Tax=Acidocella aminolytica 101 = DSM 11237 TaxID=1120923 RepID=A0A0D6PKT2_9PROT|nr:CBS domain-containing protein [Acidocella aminolytica]GAN81354.1 signal transduction protein with CBS [Acidocella aminolytica 101 = DSM 11237]GBQ33603.1 CBS domain-containing protein [Acidocella aminolytica 101 = DSM 11237]SHF42824.1 CBS domain-containing protein [Acidocella aminolytica 101 = DSM 11237]
MLIKAILKNKPPGFISVPADMTIAGVLNILAEKRIGAVLVVENTELIGILSERDIVRSLATRATDTLTMTAGALMTRGPKTATPETTVEQAMEMMTDGHFRHLPIMEDGHLTGLVSIGDVVKARIDHSQHEVDTLRTYVTGRV